MTAGAYLVTGKDDFLKEEFIRDLRRELFAGAGASEERMNFQEFDARKDPLGAVREFVLTAPFLSRSRLALYREIDHLPDEDREGLVALLKGSPPGVLILVSAESLPRKNAFLSELAALCQVASFHPPFDRDLPAWVRTRAKKVGVALEETALPALVERAGKETAALDSALQQLAVYVHPRTRVGLGDVAALLGRSAEQDVFRVVQRVLERDLRAATGQVELLLERGVRAAEIIGLLSVQLDRVRRAAALLGAGSETSEVGRRLGVHPFYLPDFIRMVQKISGPDLREMTARLLTCDEAVKTGRLPERLALEGFILGFLRR